MQAGNPCLPGEAATRCAAPFGRHDPFRVSPWRRRISNSLRSLKAGRSTKRGRVPAVKGLTKLRASSHGNPASTWRRFFDTTRAGIRRKRMGKYEAATVGPYDTRAIATETEAIPEDWDRRSVFSRNSPAHLLAVQAPGCPLHRYRPDRAYRQSELSSCGDIPARRRLARRAGAREPLPGPGFCLPRFGGGDSGLSTGSAGASRGDFARGDIMRPLDDGISRGTRRQRLAGYRDRPYRGRPSGDGHLGTMPT